MIKQFLRVHTGHLVVEGTLSSTSKQSIPLLRLETVFLATSLGSFPLLSRMSVNAPTRTHTHTRTQREREKDPQGVTLSQTSYTQHRHAPAHQGAYPTPHCPTPFPQQNVCAPEEDPELKVELYTRSPEQNELLGLDQMDVD